MFANAKKVEAVTLPAKGKSTKVVDVMPGLAEVAALDACAKAIKGLLDMKKAQLKEAATATLIERGVDKGSRPDSMTLAEGAFATGRAAITKRATTSPLSPDELEVLASLAGAEVTRDEAGAIVAIEGFAETLEQVPAMLAVNPAYAGNEALLKKIDKALSGVKGIPEDFIVQTAAKAKVVVAETAPDQVFKLESEMAEQVFPLIAGVSVGASFKDIEKAWEIVKPMLAPDAATTKVVTKKMFEAAAAAGRKSA